MWFWKKKIEKPEETDMFELPLSVEEPDAWNAGFSTSLRIFIEGRVGQGLMARLYEQCYSRCLTTKELSPHEQGSIAGIASVIGMIEHLSNVDYWQALTADDAEVIQDA